MLRDTQIDPLRRKLSELDAWITGQRMDQSVTRANLPNTQVDEVFEGANGTLYKFNPLSVALGSIWHYIRTNNTPFNPLHSRGFVSIGCEPAQDPSPLTNTACRTLVVGGGDRKNAVCTAKILSRGVRQ